MSRLQELLANGPILTDGAWGTELQKRGLGPGELADLWNLEHPDQVLAVAQAYVEAGSRVILTNTFRANAIALTGQCSEDWVDGINRAGVEISRRAANAKSKVFASIGPTGRMMTDETVTPAMVELAFRRQAEVCAEAGAYALLLETFSDREEARIALQAARATGLPVVLSFAFDSGKKKDRTMMGLTPEQAAQLALEGEADAVGANCGVGMDQAVELCRRLRAAAPGLPVWIKPNAGLPVLEDGQIVYRTDAATFALQVPALLEAGASFVGGCCGSNPEFIRAVAAEGRVCDSF